MGFPRDFRLDLPYRPDGTGHELHPGGAFHAPFPLVMVHPSSICGTEAKHAIIRVVAARAVFRHDALPLAAVENAAETEGRYPSS